MIERLVKEAGKNPAVVIALTGVVGGLLVAGARSGRLPLPEGSTASIRSRTGEAIRGRAGELIETTAATADEVTTSIGRLSREAVDRVGGEASRVGERVPELGERLGELAGRLPEPLSGQLSRPLSGHRPRSRLDDVRDNAAAFGLTEKSVAVFAATFLAKAAGSYLRWRGEQSARLQAEALASEDRRGFPAQLGDRTVAELRQMASGRDIEGRSSMNKDELVAALGEP